MSETKNINSQEKDPELFEVYELAYHILPNVTQEELPEKLDEIKKLIESFGAEFISEEAPKLIDLAYTMIVPKGGHNEKYNKAYFGWIKFELEKARAPELQQELKLNANILRFIMFKTVREDTRANVDLDAILGKNKKDEQDSNQAGQEQDHVAETEKSDDKKDEIDKSIENIVS